MAQKWVSVAQACETFGVSRRTLTRWIKSGKVESKLENSRRLVHLIEEGHDKTPEGHIETTMSQQVLNEQLRSENELLKQQIEYLKEQIQEKDKQIERQQMIVMQLSRDIESQQKMLEDQTRRKGVSFWRRRVFGRRGASEREE